LLFVLFWAILVLSGERSFYGAKVFSKLLVVYTSIILIYFLLQL
jgi:hypothetical protein